MKKTIHEVIVVEGKSDVKYLSSFIQADFVITDGSSLPLSTINLVKQLEASGRKIIILTDPDGPGEKIRRTLSQSLTHPLHAFINPLYSRKNNKIGVAECSQEEILKSLEKLVTFNEFTQSIRMEEYLDLKLTGAKDSQLLRIKISNYFRLGFGSSKTIFKRLNMLGITKKEIQKVLEDEDGNHCN